MGKHIYCEKPMTWNIEQAKKVVAKIKSTGVKMQVGVQGMSDDSYEAANKLVKEGALGKVVLAQIDYSRNHKGDEFWAYPIDADCKPGVNLDWNAWLGPAKKRPFQPERFFRWRLFWGSLGRHSDGPVHSSRDADHQVARADVPGAGGGVGRQVLLCEVDGRGAGYAQFPARLSGGVDGATGVVDGQ